MKITPEKNGNKKWVRKNTALKSYSGKKLSIPEKAHRKNSWKTERKSWQKNGERAFWKKLTWWKLYCGELANKISQKKRTLKRENTHRKVSENVKKKKLPGKKGLVFFSIFAPVALFLSAVKKLPQNIRLLFPEKSS